LRPKTTRPRLTAGASPFAPVPDQFFGLVVRLGIGLAGVWVAGFAAWAVAAGAVVCAVAAVPDPECITVVDVPVVPAPVPRCVAG
jgi:hypothetical protein